jgi:hypothetical protein
MVSCISHEVYVGSYRLPRSSRSGGHSTSEKVIVCAQGDLSGLGDRCNATLPTC